MDNKGGMMKLFYVIIALILSSILGVGTFFILNVNNTLNPALFIIIFIAEILISIGVAIFLARIIVKLVKKIISVSNTWTVTELLIGGSGSIIALLIAFLLGFSIQSLPIIGVYINLLLSIVFAYIGWTLAVKRKDEILQLISKGKKKDLKIPDKYIDTSVLIDGRIFDVIETNFLEGDFIIPDFVIDELQRLADSEDSLIRAKGRRGFDVLKKIQDTKILKVIILATDGIDFGDTMEVDSKLVRIVILRGGSLITTDFNLNKVADVQGVKVLNVNDLANALKPALIHGEEFRLKVIKKGKENHQGVGYLEDGTMVIIEDGGEKVGKEIDVVVHTIMQTSAGRLIFTKEKDNE